MLERRFDIAAGLLVSRVSVWELAIHPLAARTGLELLLSPAGFRYVYDEASGEYAHASGIMVATTEGVLSRYLYGIELPTRQLRLSLWKPRRPLSKR